MDEITEEETGQGSEETINMEIQRTLGSGRNNWGERSFRGQWKILLGRQAVHRSVNTITGEKDRTRVSGRNNWGDSQDTSYKRR